jgi:hypothetical protein
LRRGKATSRAPRCKGKTKLPKPVTAGMMARKIMMEACIVNIWLKKLPLIRSLWWPHSCIRSTKAIAPPTKKKMKEVHRYITPIFL